MSLPISRAPKHAYRERGQGIAEFALLMPVVLLILMGMFDFGRAVYAHSVIANSAREGARVAVTFPENPCSAAASTAATAAIESKAVGLDLTQLTIGVTCPTTDTVRVEVDYTFEFVTPIIAHVVSGDGTLALGSAATMFTGVHPMTADQASDSRRQSGQVLVLVAVMLVGVIAMLALALDGGNMYAQRRRAQNAADAASLAAALRLASEWTDAGIQGIVTEYAQTRNSAASASAQYLPSEVAVGGGSVPEGSIGVRVHTTRNASAFFGGVIGRQDSTVAASAAALYELVQSGCGGYAIWAHGNTCKVEFDWSGGGGLIEGNVHSNGNVKVTGTGHMVSGVCEYVGSVQDNTSDIEYLEVEYKSELPIEWDITDYQPGGIAATAAITKGEYWYHDCPLWSIASSEHTVAKGLHYCTGDVSISGSGQYGHVTIVALGTIQLTGSDCTYECYVDGLLFFANHEFPPTTKCNQWVIKMTVQGGSYTGFLYAPNGQIEYNSSAQNVVDGGLICWSADISGNEFTINYSDEICGDRALKTIVRLIE